MLEQFRDRMDIDKFAHPEIVDTYEMADVTPLTTNGAVYDQSVRIFFHMPDHDAGMESPVFFI